jgi:hypothetical protein
MFRSGSRSPPTIEDRLVVRSHFGERGTHPFAKGAAMKYFGGSLAAASRVAVALVDAVRPVIWAGEDSNLGATDYECWPEA